MNLCTFDSDHKIGLIHLCTPDSDTNLSDILPYVCPDYESVRYTSVRLTPIVNPSGICAGTSASDHGFIQYSSVHLIPTVGLSDMLLHVWLRI